MTRDIGTLEHFLDEVRTSNTEKRLKLAEEISLYLSDASNSIDFHGTDTLIDAFTGWAGSSNFKISQCGLEVLEKFADRLAGSFKSKLNSVLPTVVDRLGDSKPQIRECALKLISKCMVQGSSPQLVLEMLLPSFTHKNWRVREQLLVMLIRTVNTFGADNLQLSKAISSICKLLGDPNSKVRESALDAVVEVYRHVGERVRADLCKKGVPAARLASIYARFDECLKDGTMKVSAETSSSSAIANGQLANLQLDNDVKSKSKSPLRRSASYSAPRRKGAVDRGNHASSAAGGVNAGVIGESDLISSWDDIPENKSGGSYSARDASEELAKINACLSDANNDWERRVAALKQLRSVVKYSEYDHIKKMIRDLENCLRISLKDLRSSVTKEACTTLSFMSAKYGLNFDFLAEALMPAFINLIPNSAKIMSSSANSAIRLILKHTPYQRLVPHYVTNLLTNKNKDIRRRCAEYVVLLLETWDGATLKGHVALLEEVVRKGIGDADSETRAAMRRAFWQFEEHYPERANNIMEGLDASKQKLLQSDKTLLKAGLATVPASSFGQVKTRPIKARTASASSDADEATSKSMRPPAFAPARRPPSAAGRDTTTPHRPVAMPGMQRSASHMDGRSFRTPQMHDRQKSCDDFRAKSAARNARTTSSAAAVARRTGAGQPASSQPTSPPCAGYPAAPKFSRERSEDYMKYHSPLRTKIPTPRHPHSRGGSRSGSRDASPTRVRTGSQSAVPHDRRERIHSNGQRQANGKPMTEEALWSAYAKSADRRRFDSISSTHNDAGSDGESETSSVCSDTSSGNKKALLGKDTSEVITMLNSQSWSDRRDGLAYLQTYFRTQPQLTMDNVARFRDSFNKFFADPHNKVYSLFLSVLSDFVVGYKNSLSDWLFVLLTRLLHKLGTEMLPSLHAKVTQVLDVVKDSFPYDHQFQILTKYIIDRSQTPTLKMKVAILQCLQELIASMDPNDFRNSGDTRQAVSKIIAWAAEPKSPDVRKEAAAVIVALFELNTPEMSMMMSLLPNSLRDGASKVLHIHLKPMAAKTAVSPFSLPPRYDDDDANDPSDHADAGYHPHTVPQNKNIAKARLGYRSMSPSKTRAAPSSDGLDCASPSLGDSTTSGRQSSGDGAESFQSPGGTRIPVVTKLQFNTPDTNSPRAYSSPRMATAESGGSHRGLDSEPSSSTSSPFSLSKVTPPPYDPKQYEDQDTSLSADAKSAVASPEMLRVADGAEEPDQQFEGSGRGISSLGQVRAVLSMAHNDAAGDDVKASLLELIKLVRASSSSSDVSRTLSELLPAIIAMFGYDEASLRCLAVRVVREAIRSQPSSYSATLVPLLRALLELQQDAEKEVAKTAEECCTLMAQLEQPGTTLDALCPVVMTADFPTNHAAVKMMNVVVDNCSSDVMTSKLPSLCAPLLKLYDHEESTVRKACVFCLVSIHNVVGLDVLMPHLKDLSGSKMRLLELYISRSRGSSV